jgi:hypothetical protein
MSAEPEQTDRSLGHSRFERLPEYELIGVFQDAA